jgi:group I intron endonuclease
MEQTKTSKIYSTEFRKYILSHSNECIEDVFRTGVYAIVNKVNGNKYVGSASQVGREYIAKEGFYVRWYLHVSDLEAKKHHCKYLENAWHKYGHENFEFKILEFCNPDQCLEREQYYLDLYWDSKTLYNGSSTARSNKGAIRTEEWKRKISESRAKEWEFVSPEGETIKIKNLSKFCRENNLEHALMSAVYHGKRSHHKGWSAVGSDYKYLKYEFVSPEGRLYRFPDLKAFCKEHGLCQAGMSAVHNNYRVKQYKGWYLPGNKPVKKSL